jgi:hypothetical protein
VEITGANFVPGSSVTIGGVPATQVDVLASGDLKATTPPRDAGPASIVVTNPDGRSATLAVGFTYVNAADSPVGSSPKFVSGSGGCSSSSASPALLLLAATTVLARWRGWGRRRSQMN